MPVPTEELKLELVHAATGRPLGAGAVPGPDGALVVRAFPEGEPGAVLWQFAPVEDDGGGDAYVIRDAADGQVLEAPEEPEAAVRRASAAAGRESQQWRLLPVEGEAGLYVIEGASEGTVLDLAGPGPDEEDTEGDEGEAGTPVVLRAYDESAESQRWRLVTEEPERTSDLVLRWAPLSHWNSRRSWRLTDSPALRPAPGATPSFSDMLLVLDRFGSDEKAGGWASEGVSPSPGGAGRWAGLGARFLADTTGTGRTDVVGVQPAKGAVAVSGRGDGTFEEEERIVHPPAPSPSPADLWTLADLTGEGRPAAVVLAADGVRVAAQGEDGDGTFAPGGGELVLGAFGHGEEGGGWHTERHPRFLADTTGDGRLDLLGCHDDGLWISLQDEEGTFAPLGDEPALPAFGHGEEAGGWHTKRHPRFLADTTGDGRLDLLGCHDDGLWISLQDEEGAFAEPLYILDEFGVEQGWKSAEEHPRFLVATTEGEPVDVVGFGPQGVVVARGRGDGTFEPAKLVLNDFGSAQGWTSRKHLRLLADVTGDGNPDVVGFGDEGVWVAHGLGGGQFEQAQLVCRGFGYHPDAGGWRVGRHPRFLADVTGDGRLDLVGFGGPGVYVARNLFRRFRTR
ncbi:FG-GAP-like repeat-containing protein [Streptomyces albidoflavus]